MSTEDDQFLVDGRPIHELKVVELRKELEIRNLPKSGNKKELVDRLLNFLREEQEELIKQQQTLQEESNQENKKQSPTTTPILPDMVSQYLVQQQIQLEAAKRDADKFRASSSYDSTSSTTFPSQMVQQEIDQQITGHEPDKTEHFPQEHDINEFVPDEPSVSVQEQMVESIEPYLQQTEAVDEIVQDNSQQEINSNDENEESEVDDKAQPSTESSANDEGFDDIKGDDEDTMPAAEEGIIIIPPVVAKDEESDVEVGSKKENSEYDEEECDDVVDDSGKRRRKDLSSFEEKELERDFEENKNINENNQKGSDGEKLFEKDQFAPQTVATPQQISSSFESRRTERRRSSTILASVEMLESSRPPLEQQQKEQEEITPDGFVRKRAASPARNSPSRWIHIRGLKRPYTQRALLDLLGKFGTVDEHSFWIDSIKSNCIVTYDTVEQAEFARERLHNVIWPIASTDSLCLEFSTDEKLKRRQSEEEQNEPTLRFRGSGTFDSLQETGGRSGFGGLTIVVDNRHPISPSGPQVHIQHEKEQQKEAEIRKRKAEELEKSQDKLNQLFKKTKVQPSLYYLPLSDAEAAKRRSDKKQSSSTNKNISSTRERATREHRKDNENNRDSHHQRSSNHHSSYQRTSGGGGNDRRRTEATSSNRR